MGTQLPKGTQQFPHFSVHIYCDQTAGWMKMPLGTEVGLSPGDIVLDADTAPQKGHISPHFSAHDYCGKRSPISATVELLFLLSAGNCYPRSTTNTSTCSRCRQNKDSGSFRRASLPGKAYQLSQKSRERFATTQPSLRPIQPSTLSGTKMNTGQSAVTVCGWGVKAGVVYSTCG